MSLLTLEQIVPYEGLCTKLLAENGVRFAGLINNRGRLIAGGFKQGVQPHENDEQRQMMYMELMLDLSMRREFDTTLGKIRSITSRREKVNLTTIPTENNLLLLSTELYVDIEKVVSKAYELVNEVKKLGVNH